MIDNGKETPSVNVRDLSFDERKAFAKSLAEARGHRLGPWVQYCGPDRPHEVRANCERCGGAAFVGGERWNKDPVTGVLEHNCIPGTEL
jgi:hypothetical protein